MASRKRKRSKAEQKINWIDPLLTVLQGASLAADAVPGSPAKGVLNMAASILQTCQDVGQNTEEVKELLRTVVDLSRAIVGRIPPSNAQDLKEGYRAMCNAFVRCLEFLNADIERLLMKRKSKFAEKCLLFVKSKEIRLNIKKHRDKLQHVMIEFGLLTLVEMRFADQRAAQATHPSINLLSSSLADSPSRPADSNPTSPDTNSATLNPNSHPHQNQARQPVEDDLHDHPLQDSRPDQLEKPPRMRADLDMGSYLQAKLTWNHDNTIGISCNVHPFFH